MIGIATFNPTISHQQSHKLALMNTHQHRSGRWTITYHIFSFIGRDKIQLFKNCLLLPASSVYLGKLIRNLYSAFKPIISLNTYGLENFNGSRLPPQISSRAKKSFVSCDFQEKRKKKSNQFSKLSSLVKKKN